MAFGLTTAVLAALVASATLLPPPTPTVTPSTRRRQANRHGPANSDVRVDHHLHPP